MNGAVSLPRAFAGFTQQWAPRIVGRYEGHEIRIARVQGAFDWHRHPHDELFYVIEGSLVVEFRDRTERLAAGDLLVVPAGTEHRPVAAEGEAKLLLMDPAGSPNTGDAATATPAVPLPRTDPKALP